MQSLHTFIRALSSRLQRINIELTRIIDHSWRNIRGVLQWHKSMITTQLYLGGQHSYGGLRRLKRQGITAIVNMREKVLHEAQVTAGFSSLHLPTKDQTAPTLEQLVRGVEFIHEHIARGESVYIHCRHGEGRGPTMVAAYLMSTGMTLADALDTIRAVRNFIRPTQVQLERLHELEQHLLESSHSEAFS